VETVLINGRVIMENRKLLSMDLEIIMEKALEQSRRVRGWVPHDPGSFF
jgi:hypothetical protein